MKFKERFNKSLDSFKHNWYLYLFAFLHLAFWLFTFIFVSEVLTGNIDVSDIVDLEEVLFSYKEHEYTLFDMWFFMGLSTFMILFVNFISMVNKTIFDTISKRDYDRQVKSKK